MKNILYALSMCIFFMLPVMAADEATPIKTYPSIKPIFSERFRLVTWDNTISFSRSSGATTFTRHRTSAGAQVMFSERFEFNLKLTNECRYYVYPKPVSKGLDEVFFDHLNVAVHFGKKYPATLTVGRQNIMLGEGFVMMDGHPLDGSRSIYFNAARLDVHFDKKVNGTFFYSTQTPTDEALPIIHDRHQLLVEQPENGAGVYIKHSPQFGAFDYYFMYKRLYSNHDYPGIRSEVYTIGARAAIPINSNSTLITEWGRQFGYTYSSYYSRSGLAGYAYVDFKIDGPAWAPNKISPGMFYYSGDDPNTGNAEGWEPLFARWPKWSESYIYSQINEGGVAYWTNIESLFMRFSFAPSKETTFLFDYHYLRAPEKVVLADYYHTSISNESDIRGVLLIAKFNYRINPRLTGHVLWEFLNPNHFYARWAQDYSWIRAEVLYNL